MAKKYHNIPCEIWKAVPDFPGYEVSDYGRVRSFWKRNGGKLCRLMNRSQRILNPILFKNSYHCVNLCRDKKSYRKMVHAIVLSAFIGPCPHGMEGCHNDGDCFNNKLNNLRWDTRLNNHLDRHRHGTDHQGEKNPHSKLIDVQIKEIRKIYLDGIKTQDIGYMFNVSKSAIEHIVRNRTWTHIF